MSTALVMYNKLTQSLFSYSLINNDATQIIHENIHLIVLDII